MKAWLGRIAKWAAYPLFYLFCLVLFATLTFPFAELRGRLMGEFTRMQTAGRRGTLSGTTKSPLQLDIKELDGYWLSGVEARNVTLTIPHDKPSAASASAFGKASAAEPPPEPSVLQIQHVHGRVRLLPLLIGRVRVDFGLEALGGEMFGTLPWGSGSGGMEVTFEKLQLGEVTPLRALLGIPILGTISGLLELDPVGGKFAKAGGKFELKLERVVVGDGKSKLQGVELPAAQLGDISIVATAKDGTLKIDEITANGRDLELQGDGKIKLREPWHRSQLDINIAFRFTDAYRDRDDATRGLLGKPGSKIPPAIEFSPQIKRAKREDGFYGWHIHGTLSDPNFDPQSSPSAKATARPRPTGSGGRVSTSPRSASTLGGSRLRRPVSGTDGFEPGAGLPGTPSPGAQVGDKEARPSPAGEPAPAGPTEPAEQQPPGDEPQPEPPPPEEAPAEG